MLSSKVPSEKSINKWKGQFSWLLFTDEKKMVCSVCSSQEDKLRSMPNVSMTFINGSTNFRLSSLKDHDSSECHQRATREKEHEVAVAAGISLAPRKVIQQTPSNSAIKQCFQHMGELEKESVQKLHDIAYYIASKGHAFTDFKDHIELEKLHEVKYSGAYENESACRDFIFSISEYFFEEGIKKKLETVNFLAILCDGSTDKSITEQEVLFVVFTDPETCLPTMKFFHVVAPSDSQDAPGLKQAITDTFKKHFLESALKKIVFLSSDGASVNCGKNSGLIRLFQEDYPWMCFVWCFSHRLELALKDALKDFMEPVDTTLRHLYYLYTKSSKKHRELKNLYVILEGQFEMFSAGVRPVKATGTRWIDHKLRVMDRLVEKFGLYAQHLQNVISTSLNKVDKSTLEGKFAKVLLRCALFIDVLAEAKKFSLITQKSDVDIITIIDYVESTKYSYEWLLKWLRKNSTNVFKLPTVKLVVEAIESNEDDGEPLYQNQKVHYYIREKRYIENHIVEIVDSIISCFERRYGNLYSDASDAAVNVNADEGDWVIFDICCVLNCNVWPDVTPDSDLQEKFSVQLTALQKIFNRYKNMEVFNTFTSDDVTESFCAVTRYSSRYFNTSNVKPIEFWSKILLLHQENNSWKATLLLVELCLCAPFSNASLERLFSHMNIVKTTVRNRLSNESLNSTLRIRVSGISVATFHTTYLKKCVHYWYNAKNRRLHQRKRKAYNKRESKKIKRTRFDINDLSSLSSSSESDDSGSDIR